MKSNEKKSLKKDINPLNTSLTYGTEKTIRVDSSAQLLNDEPTLPYPKSVFFIIVNEFCERFSYYGMKAVLTLYLKNVLEFEEDPATVIYHVFSMFCYFTCVFGAMISDSFLGKFKTIFYLSVVYAAGNILLSLAATKDVGLPQTEFSMFGLALIALGTGGIKPCVAAFGGDQFKLPEQERQLTTFFSVFYFSINAGSLISTTITPIFRKDVQCFGRADCYPLAFSVPAVLMIIALIIFLCGKPFYNVAPPMGNVVMKVTQCITHALKRKSASTATREHWLDHADDEYPRELIEDIKVVLRVLFLYLPLPFFWALFDQQGSRWTFQATRMDGEIFGITIKPDQMQVVNPLLILALIPLFDQIIYPLLDKCHLLRRPLQRLTVGGILAGIAFVVSGILEIQLEPTYAIELKSMETNLNFVNTLPCNIMLSLPDTKEENITQYGNKIFSQIEAKDYAVKIVPDKTNPACSSIKEYTYSLKAVPQKAYTYIIELESGSGNGNVKRIKVFRPTTEDDLEKSKNDGMPKIRLIHSGLAATDQWGENTNTTVELKTLDLKKEIIYKIHINSNDTAPLDIEASHYEVKLVSEVTNDTVDLGTFKFRLGGVYVFTLTKNLTKENIFTGQHSYVASSYVITEPNSVHMLWLLPQFIIITVGEIMFSITGLEFSYSQAPASMKAVMQSAWLLTVAFGNLIVVIVAEAHIFKEQSKEFFLFSGLMFVDMVLFAVMAYFYKPANLNNNTKESENEMTERKGNKNAGFVPEIPDE